MASLSVDQRRALEEAATATPTIRRVADAFAAAGYDLHLVGGPVRDALMGRGVHDLDFTTAARPDVIETILGRLTPATWDIGRAFGTIGASLNDDVVEVTTYRADSYDPSSRKPTVEFGDDLTADLVRRDFTVNALFFDLQRNQVLDYVNGQKRRRQGNIRYAGC